MKNEFGRMCAIWQRDLTSLFITPIGYVFIALFIAVMDLMFYLFNVMEWSADLESLFSSMLVVLMFITPLLTMRLFSEEFKQKTDHLLFTAPVRIGSVVLGKFLAALTVFTLSLSVVLIWSVVIQLFGRPNMASILGNTVAVFCSGNAFIAIGILISALTESQVIAAVGSFAAYLAIFLLDYAAANINMGILSGLIRWLSLFSRYNRFSLGVFSVADIVYYLSVTGVVLLITTRVLQSKYHS